MFAWLRTGFWWIPLLVAAVMGGVGVYAYRALEHSTRTQLSQQLETILEADVEALYIWIEGQKAVTRSEAGSMALLPPVRELLAASRSGPDAAEALRASPAVARVRELLAPAVRDHGFTGYSVLDPGALVLAAANEQLVGRRLVVPTGPFERVLAGESVFLRAVSDVTGDVDPQTFAMRGVVFQSAAPMRDRAGAVIAVLAFPLGAAGGFSEILQVARMGESGETYAFDQQGTMLSQSRFVDQLVEIGLLPSDPEERRTSLVQIRDPGGDLTAGFEPQLPVLARPLTRMAAAAVAGRSGHDVVGYRDYRGVEVIGAWTWIPELRLGVATEIDTAEAYTGLYTLRRTFGALAAVLVLAAFGMFFYSVLLGRLQRRFDRIRKLGRYEMIEKIGEGGMGKVYLARHALLRRPTAVKLLEPSKASDEAIRRFEREVQSTSSLTHPNTISIFDYGRTPDGIFYYAMEYLEGIDLGRLVSGWGAQPEARCAHILRQAASSLSEAHAAGLVHRDLKPSNIMLCLQGGMFDFAKVLDFGLVRGGDASSGEMTLTNVQSLTGTPLYLSPEALEAPTTVSARSDVYQLGAILYYLLTGRHVFTGESMVEVLSQHLNTTPTPPSEVLGHPISQDLEELVLRCLGKKQDERPQHGGELLEALEHCRIEGVWSQHEAREWWLEFGADALRRRPGGESTSSSFGSGWQIEVGRSRVGTSRAP